MSQHPLNAETLKPVSPLKTYFVAITEHGHVGTRVFHAKNVADLQQQVDKAGVIITQILLVE